MAIVYRSPETEKEFENYFKFRWEQLRKPLDLTQGSEQDELENHAFHIAAYNNKNIIGVGRLNIEKNQSARIRYMAVDNKFRKQGIGSRLLEELEKIAKAKDVIKCWLNARESAASFYLKNSYEIRGEATSELEIPHLRMEKTL